jgi:hypothetical protein
MSALVAIGESSGAGVAPVEELMETADALRATPVSNNVSLFETDRLPASNSTVWMGHLLATMRPPTGEASEAFAFDQPPLSQMYARPLRDHNAYNDLVDMGRLTQMVLWSALFGAEPIDPGSTTHIDHRADH